VLALNRFYQTSVALTLTLHLDSMVTLVPGADSVAQTTLVREDMPIEELLAMAGRYRPDLEAVRTLLRSTEADTGTAIWGGLGPQLQAGYTFGGLQTSTSSKDYGLHEQQRAGVGASFALGLSTFGLVKVADANERLAAVDVQRQSDLVRAAVVSAQQNSVTNAKLIPVARRQLDAAEQALRLAQANLQAGTQLTIDVLQVQAEVDRARLRYVDAVVHYNQAQVSLLAALGMLVAPAPAPGVATR
jgi:outer membrane protein TolC